MRSKVRIYPVETTDGDVIDASGWLQLRLEYGARASPPLAVGSWSDRDMDRRLPCLTGTGKRRGGGR